MAAAWGARRPANQLKNMGMKMVAMKVAASIPPNTPVPMDLRAAAPALIEGVELTQRELLNVFKRHGIQAITPQVGDKVGLGISHPCTTFDKWRWMAVVDRNYDVVDAIVTCL